MTQPPPPPPEPGYPQSATPENGYGTAALVMGILQFVCLGTVGSVLAVVFGKMGMNRAEEGKATNGDMARWGFWLGIIGLAISAVALIFVVVLAVLAANNSTVG